jgi:hypothetical protein
MHACPGPLGLWGIHFALTSLLDTIYLELKQSINTANFPVLSLLSCASPPRNGLYKLGGNSSTKFIENALLEMYNIS